MGLFYGLFPSIRASPLFGSANCFMALPVVRLLSKLVPRWQQARCEAIRNNYKLQEKGVRRAGPLSRVFALVLVYRLTQIVFY